MDDRAGFPAAVGFYLTGLVIVAYVSSITHYMGQSDAYSRLGRV